MVFIEKKNRFVTRFLWFKPDLFGLNGFALFRLYMDKINLFGINVLMQQRGYKDDLQIKVGSEPLLGSPCSESRY